MRLVLSGTLFTTHGIAHSDLVMLVKLAVKRRHIVQLKNDDAWLTWLSTLGATLMEELQSLVDFNMRLALEELPEALIVHVEASLPQSQWTLPTLRLNVSDTLNLLDLPLGLLFENNLNDWNFLLRLAQGPDRKTLQVALQERQIERLQGGGATITGQMKLRAQHSPEQKTRTFVMFDSDRLHPDELSPDWDNRAPGYTNENVCGAVAYELVAQECFPQQHHRLQRRFIESYMPLSALKAWCEREGEGADPNVRKLAFEHFKCLSDGQRWFYNMKGGFRGDEQSDEQDARRKGLSRARQRDLYGDLSTDARRKLEQGFGTRLSAWYDRAIYPPEFDWDEQARAEGDLVLQKIFQLL